MIVCAIDETAHPDVESLHAHLKGLRVSRESYYHQYHPRRDPVSGELIPFKDLDQYLSQDFVSKITLKKWLKDKPEEGKEWARAFLTKRKMEKNLVYAPSQAELRTLCCPSMPYYQSIGGYYEIARELGFKDRYSILDPTFAPLPPGSIIVQDTREQAPISFPEYRSSIDTLTVGDYALSPVNSGGTHIERKSLADFCGTLSARKNERENKTKANTEWSNLERFGRELERAQSLGIYLVMVVEASIEDAQRFNYLPQTRWIKASPSYILHNMRDLLHRFPLTWQVVFVAGRKEMARVIPRIFQMGETVRQCDLQFAYEGGKL